MNFNAEAGNWSRCISTMCLGIKLMFSLRPMSKERWAYRGSDSTCLLQITKDVSTVKMRALF